RYAGSSYAAKGIADQRPRQREGFYQRHHARFRLLPVVKVFPWFVMDHDRVPYPLPSSRPVEYHYGLPAAMYFAFPDLRAENRTLVGAHPSIGEMWRHQGQDLRQITLAGHHRENTIWLQRLLCQTRQITVQRQVFFCVWRICDNGV